MPQSKWSCLVVGRHEKIKKAYCKTEVFYGPKTAEADLNTESPQNSKNEDKAIYDKWLLIEVEG